MKPPISTLRQLLAAVGVAGSESELTPCEADMGADLEPAVAGALAVLLCTRLVVVGFALLVLFFSRRLAAIAQRATLFTWSAARLSGWSIVRFECADAFLNACGAGDASAPSPTLPRCRGCRRRDGPDAVVAGSIGRAAIPAAIAPGGVAADCTQQTGLDRGRTCQHPDNCGGGLFADNLADAMVAYGCHAGRRMFHQLFRGMDGSS